MATEDLYSLIGEPTPTDLRKRIGRTNYAPDPSAFGLNFANMLHTTNRNKILAQIGASFGSGVGQGMNDSNNPEYQKMQAQYAFRKQILQGIDPTSAQSLIKGASDAHNAGDTELSMALLSKAGEVSKLPTKENIDQKVAEEGAKSKSRRDAENQSKVDFFPQFLSQAEQEAAAKEQGRYGVMQSHGFQYGDPNVSVHSDPMTGFYKIDKKTGKVTTLKEGAMGAVTPETMQGDVETHAERIASGLEPALPTTGWGRSNVYNLRVMNKVREMNPTYTPIDYTNKAAADKYWTSTTGGLAQITPFNAAIAHLDTLDKLAQALDNKDFNLANRVGQFFAKETGQPAPTSFVAAKTLISRELVKMVANVSGGSVTEQQEVEKNVSEARSYEQLKSIIDTYQELGVGQLQARQQAYEAGTHKTDFVERFLAPASRAVYDKYTHKEQPQQQPSTQGQGVQEGTQAVSKSGKPIIFRNGRWEYP